MSPTKPQYRAFISYSHKDAKWAKWLHRGLERYVVPIDAFAEGEKFDADGTGKSRRLTPIFRDRDELPASGSLSDTIQQALESSENLIVLCSPNSAASQYVNAEIKIFRSLHPDNEKKIYALIIEGKPPECFPPALIADGAEPIAADAREVGDGKPDAKLKLIAGMLGVGFDRLKRREAKRQRNRLLVMVSVVSAVAVMTSALALWALKAEQETKQALAREEHAKRGEMAQRKAAEKSATEANEALLREEAAKQGETMQRKAAEKSANAANEARELAEQSAKESKEVLVFFNQNIFGALKPKTGLGTGGLGLNVTLAEAIEAAEANIENSFTDQPLVEAAIRMRLGNAYQIMGNKGNEVILQWKRAFELRKRELGPEHPDTLKSMGSLIGGYRGVWRTPEELALTEELVELKKRLFGTRHKSALSSQIQLAHSYLRTGRINDAVTLLEEAFRLLKETLGPEHPLTIGNMISLTDAYTTAGRYEDALVTGEECLRLQIKAHGFDSHKVNVRFYLAVCYKRVGRHQNAISLLEDAVSASESVWGPGHSTPLDLKRNLASFYESAKRPEEALVLRKQIVKLWDKTYGPEAFGTIGSLRGLAWAHQKMGHLEDAEQQYRKALLAQKNKDAGHLLYFLTQKRLGAVLAQQEKFTEAETLFLTAYDGMNGLPHKGNTESKELKSCLVEIVKFYKSWDKPEQAAEWRTKVEAIETSDKLNAASKESEKK
ncbi:MAG: tetratricopeptide repeat protein [Verrucomicrobia bacterium]|nr:tetratricopeptide repeat protein [Verrucomicrobiota bacterium]